MEPLTHLYHSFEDMNTGIHTAIPEFEEDSGTSETFIFETHHLLSNLKRNGVPLIWKTLVYSG